MRKYIPNTVTLCAAFFGAIATALAMQGHLEWSCYAILMAAFCDFADGFLARLLHAQSALGADLDSLSDVISFGIAPAALAYQLLYATLPETWKLAAFAAFLIVPFSALRLAIFNNATTQKTAFEGLPVPAHAMLWVGLAFLSLSPTSSLTFLLQPIALLVYILVFSLLLVSKLPLFSLKFTKGQAAAQLLPIGIFLLIAIGLLVFFGLGGLFFIIILYVLTGVFSILK